LVRDLVLFERETLALGPGLNAVTGETGAGKSLLVGALELLLGQRPRPGLVRPGAERARVEGRFRVAPGAPARALGRWIRSHLPALAAEWRSGDAEERELILGREVLSDGRTRAYVDQRPVTRRLLAELARRLVEIHGQNDHQRLLEPSEQLILLDHFGGLEGELEAYRRARRQWLERAERALALHEARAARRQRLELLRHDLAELRAAAPEAGEEEGLRAEREVLRHASGLGEELGALVQELLEADGARVDRLRRAERVVGGWRERVAALAGPAEELALAAGHLEDAAAALRTFTDRLEVDPARLEAVEERLAELERLARKHGRDAAGLAALAPELEAERAALEADEASLEGLADEVARARAAVLAAGGELRRARKAQKPKLVRAVEAALGKLGLERARFDLRLGQRAGEERPAEGRADAGGLDRAAFEADRELFGERGIDRIEFLLAANPGQEPAKLRQVASGGETARIMLALRGALARRGAGRARVLVFDEIDAGVGGRLGPAVGEALKALGAHHQVLCVTHLPAVAALADRHLRVVKEIAGQRARTRVEALDGEARVDEIADMIAGGAAEDTARAEARRLLALR
jgi:DNA repair protein RecN (Recombination protein N)